MRHKAATSTKGPVSVAVQRRMVQELRADMRAAHDAELATIAAAIRRVEDQLRKRRKPSAQPRRKSPEAFASDVRRRLSAIRAKLDGKLRR